MIKRIISIACAAVLLFSGVPARLTAFAEGQRVRVGFFEFSGYHQRNEDGELSGYGYDLLQEISAHTNFSYEYIGYESSYADCLEMLKNGEVDIVTSVSKTPEREMEFLFSEKNIGYNSTIMTVKSGSTDIIAGKYSTYDGKKIGMLEGNSKNDTFEEFAKENSFDFEPVYFDTNDELTGALQSGEVDAAVSGSLRALENEWLVESISPTPFYICTNKEDTELMEQIDQAIALMDEYVPDWRNDLKKKYYSSDTAGNLVLSASEREFIEEFKNSGGKLKILVNPARPPYSYFDEKTGKADGIYPAVFEALIKRISLPYEYIQAEDQADYYRIRRQGEADIVLDYTENHYLAEQEGYAITSSYYDASFSQITRSDHKGEISTFALTEDYPTLSEYIKEYFPEKKVMIFPTMADCLAALDRGEADAIPAYSYMAESILREDEKNNLSASQLGSVSLVYGINKKADNASMLLSIMNKCISGVNSRELSSLIREEVEGSIGDYTFTLTGYIYNHPIYVLIALAFLFAFITVTILLIWRMASQKRLQVEIAQATKELESKTKELESKTKELEAALEAADSANRAKTTFLNNMSHDIRTPMNAIIGFTALATTHLDNRDRALDYLDKITQASNHLLSLINDILDMSRIEAGKVTIEEHPANLPEILQGLRNIIQTDIHAKHMELFIDTVNVSNEDIFCDKLRINQILLNLVSNAIKFTDPGGTVSILVKQKPSEKSGCAVYEFRVKDNGIGMSEEFAKTIFEPFTRERSSTVSGIQGTGLGMAITKTIVDMMNGRISVKSEQGKGTEFTVELELKIASGTSEVGMISELAGFRSLVVDDDLVSCQSVAGMLRHIGMRAEWTMSGREAVVRAEEAEDLADPFHVYIVDWSMPDMDGIETVRQIRKVVGGESPIILMTAYDWSDIEKDARQAGVTDFISKPLFVSDLHRALETSLGKTEKADEPQQSKEYVFSGKRILLAEDNELNREIASEILSEAGFEVDCAENGRECCDMLVKRSYDLVLMDIQMPVMDGYDAARTIRAMSDKALADIPIIAMTANAFEEDKKRVIEAGMNDYLPKPIDIDKMLEVLGEILEK